MDWFIILLLVVFAVLVACILFRSNILGWFCSVSGSNEIDDEVDATYWLIHPYLDELGEEHFVYYLKTVYDYTNTQISRAKMKSKSFEDAYEDFPLVAYLLSDIFSKYEYSTYDFLVEAEIDYSVFCAPEVASAMKEGFTLTKKQKSDISKALKDANIVLTKKQLQELYDDAKFKLKKKYATMSIAKLKPHLKKKSTYELDIVGTLATAYKIAGESMVVKPKIPEAKPKIIVKKEYVPAMSLLDQLRYERALVQRIKEEKLMFEKLLEKEKNALYEKRIKELEKELDQQRTSLNKSEEEAEKRLGTSSREDRDMNIFEQQKRLYREALENDPELLREHKRRLDEGEAGMTLFDEWLIKNNLVSGMGGDGDEQISAVEANLELENILGNM